VQDTQPNAVHGQEVAGQKGPGVSAEELTRSGSSAAAPGRAGGDAEQGAPSSWRSDSRA
jgi:hypothetical protein